MTWSSTRNRFVTSEVSTDTWPSTPISPEMPALKAAPTPSDDSSAERAMAPSAEVTVTELP